MRCIKFIWLILLTITLWCGPVLGQTGEPALDFSLSAPERDVHRQYLGLENGEPFVLGQIKADIIIIEIFSMYCPICQREAANVNTLFSLIQALPSQGKESGWWVLVSAIPPLRLIFSERNMSLIFPFSVTAILSFIKK